MDVALMIEGQAGLNWPRWQRLAAAAEDLGFAGLFRSDHFTNPSGPVLDALELWSSFTWLASHTNRIEFGPLVSPVSFRNPVVTAWTASAVDDLSAGRLRLGLGAGWQEREHDAFGFELLTMDGRFARFTEALDVITGLLKSDDSVTFDGAYYQLKDAQLMPRPARPGGPPIVIGGNGPRRTLPLAARYADEWNAVMLNAADFAQRNARLDTLLQEQGRPPGAVRRTLMVRAVTGKDAAEIRDKIGDASVDELRQRGAIVGTPDELPAQLRELENAGVQRVMLQWIDGLDDVAGIETLARATIGAA